MKAAARKSQRIALSPIDESKRLEVAAIRPVFIRLPAPKGRCPYTGLSRSALADLCVPSKANRFKPPVKSIAPKRRKDAKRAARLIDFESLMAYLLSQCQEAA